MNAKLFVQQNSILFANWPISKHSQFWDQIAAKLARHHIARGSYEYSLFVDAIVKQTLKITKPNS